MKMRRLLPWAMVLGAGLVQAHGGEDHGDAPHPQAGVAVPQLLPRGTAATEELELVGLVDGGQLVLYVDRHATNEPVADAQVEIEGAGLKGVAAQVMPGVYRLPAPALTRPGRYLLSISVQAAELADLLSMDLSVAPADEGPPHVHSRDEWFAWGVAAALLAAGAGLAGWRRYRRAGSFR